MMNSNFLCVLQPTTKLFLDGKFVDSQTKDWIELHNPVGFYSKGVI